MQQKLVNFRADAAMKTALEALAHRDGMSLSELVRSVLDERLYREANTGTIRGAARGDLPSLRREAETHYNAAMLGQHDDVEEAMIGVSWGEAIANARLAAIIGGREEALALIFLYAKLADWVASNGHSELDALYRGWALGGAEALAEDGDEEMALMVIAVAQDVTPATFRSALGWRAETMEQAVS